MSLGQHLDKFGIVGSVIAALCCLGTPAMLSIVAAMGLGFLISDAILLPLLATFLLVTLWGLALGRKRHGRIGALFLGAASALLLFVSVLLAAARPLAYLSIAGLVAASVLNVMLARPRRLVR